MHYEIKVSDSGDITCHEWSTEGYKLIMIARPGADVMFSINSPDDAADIMVDNFDEDRTLSVSWAAIGAVTPERAAQFAEGINAAVRIAGEFQQIVTSLNSAKR